MSKTDKLRGKLANMQKQREEFEQQKRELEAQMHIGRQNMGKIQKSVKTNFMHDTIQLETSDIPTKSGEPSQKTPGNSIGAKKKSNMNVKSATSPMPSARDVTGGANSSTSVASDGTVAANLIMPTGPRVSDWCYVSPLDSLPPIVKSRDLYENIRLLGRGSFGEVNLVKNVEDNKL